MKIQSWDGVKWLTALRSGLVSSDSSSVLASSQGTFSLRSVSVLEFDHQIHCEIPELFLPVVDYQQTVDDLLAVMESVA